MRSTRGGARWVVLAATVSAVVACTGGTEGVDGEAPGVEAPGVDAPGVDAPDVEAPGVDAPDVAVEEVVAGLPAPPAADARLMALVATSGAGAEGLLDASTHTGWRPVGDADGEGVLFRFEEPVTVDLMTIETCPGSGPLELALYMDGTEMPDRPLAGRPYTFESRALRSVFLRILSAPKEACLADVSFFTEGDRLVVAPPRTVPGQVTASSTLAPVDAYHVAYLFDHRTDFGWVEGADGLGVGESVVVSLDRPVAVQGLELWNGYQRSADHFAKNARLTRLGLEVDGRALADLAVEDQMGAQQIALPEPVTGREFRLTVREAAPGTRYQDLVLSELRFLDPHGPVSVSTPDGDQRREALVAEVSGKPLAQVIDREFTSYCRGASGVSSRVKLRSNHTFVHYSEFTEFVGGPDDTAREVFDGAWVVAGQGTPWSRVKLFGRRHRIETTWTPYVGDHVASETTKVSGGTLEVARVADLGRAGFDEAVGDDYPLVCWGRERQGEVYEELAAGDAVLVRGKPLVDLLWPGRRTGAR